MDMLVSWSLISVERLISFALRGVTYPSTSGQEAQKEFHTGVFQGPVQDCKMSSLQLTLGYSQSFGMDRQSPPFVHSKKGNCDWYFVTNISSVLPSSVHAGKVPRRHQTHVFPILIALVISYGNFILLCLGLNHTVNFLRVELMSYSSLCPRWLGWGLAHMDCSEIVCRVSE